MIRFFLFIFCLIVTLSASSQETSSKRGKFTLNCPKFSTQELDSLTNNWNDWSEWQTYKIVITVDTKKLRVVIVSEAKSLKYDVISININKNDSIKDDMILHCIDRDKLNCDIHLLTYHDGSQNNELVVEYENVKVAYLIEPN